MITLWIGQEDEATTRSSNSGKFKWWFEQTQNLLVWITENKTNYYFLLVKQTPIFTPY